MLHVTIDKHLLDIRKPFEQTVTQGLDSLVFVDHLKTRDAKSFAHADNLVRCQRPGTKTAFVTTTVHLRFQTDTRLTTNIQSADPFRTIGLVR